MSDAPSEVATGDALTDEVKRRALALGFARAGVARVEALEPEATQLRAWLARGHHGTMAWMERTVDVRADPRHADMLPAARRVLVLAAPYATSEVVLPSLRIARYAAGRDYHNVLYGRLRKLTRLLRDKGFDARAAVDSMPVFERAWAQRAGLGFVGKNCCLIVPGLGSHLFLAAVVTSAPLAPDAPMRERCGSCRLCLDACPTRAFTSARSLDARRCISYLTIEHRGPIDPALREPIGDRVFGCDACQDVCPFNQGARVGAEADPAFAPDGRFTGMDAAALLALDDAAFAALTNGSALKRARREGFARNVAIALGNARDRRALPVLRETIARDPSPVVREAASWAEERLSRS